MKNKPVCLPANRRMGDIYIRYGSLIIIHMQAPKQALLKKIQFSGGFFAIGPCNPPGLMPEYSP